MRRDSLIEEIKYYKNTKALENHKFKIYNNKNLLKSKSLL